VIIASVWSAVLIIFALLLGIGTIYYVNPSDWLNGVQNNFFLYFIIALAFTGIVAYTLPEKNERETELLGEMKGIRSEIDKLSKEFDDCKKIVVK